MNQSTERASECAVIYMRTPAGYAAAMDGERFGLSREQERLLRLVNGYTPIDYLVALARYGGELGDQGEDLVESLKESGLIAERPSTHH